jgi:cytoskeletal protein CcmA (bactofilin family)
MSGNDSHFDEMTGLLYFEGQLDAEHARETEGHLAECASCRALLQALERESNWLREAMTMDDEPIPARLLPAPARNMAQWIWLAAFGLMAGGAYTLWNGIVEPWYAQAQAAGFTQGNILTMLFFSGAFWKGWDAMRSVMELMAAATLGTVAIWLLRKRWRHFTAMAFVMSGLALLLALPSPAGAAEVRHGEPNFTLPAGQEVKTDLIVAADRAQIDGDVDGDLIVFAQTTTVSGHVKGDILAFGRDIRVNGTVDGNIRSCNQSLTINGTVEKNVMSWAQELLLAEKASVGGTMTLFTGDAELDGRVGGDVLAYTGAMEVNGTLNQNSTITAGERLKIGPQANVEGQITYTGSVTPEIAAGAKLASAPLVTIRKRGPNYAQARYYWNQTIRWGMAFLFGLVVLLVAPVFFGNVVQACDRVAPSIGLGVLFLFATPIAAFLACLTIVGLGLGVAAFLLYLVALYSTQIFVGSWIGEKLLGVGSGIGPAIGRLALGLVILRGLASLPFVGWMVLLATLIWGLGALALAFHRLARSRMSTAAVAAAN